MWQVKIAPSLGGGFSGTPNQVWGTTDYLNDTDPTVFFGLYGLNDFHTLWRHKGRKSVLWAGSDIRHFINGYWLDDKGQIRLEPAPLAEWLNKNVENWVENVVEHNALKEFGIDSKICPSFLGNVDDYKVEYKWNSRPSVYTSVSGDDFKLYGWDKIDKLAEMNWGVDFHLYGNKGEWKTDRPNVIVHGRVPQEQMNAEIKEMQGSLRLTEFDGASELIVKAMLWGQYAFSFIPYPHVNQVIDLGLLIDWDQPNLEGRQWWLENLNSYPWNHFKS